MWRQHNQHSSPGLDSKSDRRSYRNDSPLRPHSGSANAPPARPRTQAAAAAGIDQLAVVVIVAEKERAEMRPRTFRVGPADNNELLTTEVF